MEDILEKLLDLGHELDVDEEVLNIIINSKNIDELLILQSGLDKMRC